MVRLGDGTAESAAKWASGLNRIWRFVDELFVAENAAPVAAGIAVDVAALRTAWNARVLAVLADARLARPTPCRAVVGGRVGRHSEHLGHLLATMQHLSRSYPGAVW